MISLELKYKELSNIIKKIRLKYKGEDVIDIMDEINKILIHTILAFCISALTVLFTMAYKNTEGVKIISAIVTFVLFEIILIKFDWISFFERQSYIIKLVSVIIAFLSAVIVRERYMMDSISTIRGVLNCDEGWASNLFYLLLIFGTIALCVYYIYLLNYLYRVVYIEILSKMDSYEKIFFFSFIVIMGLLAFYVHIHTSAFDYTQFVDSNGDIVQIPFDAIMDCDTAAVQWNMKHFDFTLRHPFFATVTLPEYSLSVALGNVFPLSSQWRMAFLSLSEIFKIAICALCIMRMSKSKLTLAMYFISFPVLIYSLVIERHTWMLFWNVIMVYSIIGMNEEQQEDYMPIMQAGGANLVGVMITPVVMKVRSAGEFIKKGIILSVSFLLVIVINGNLAGLFNILDELKANAKYVQNIDILDNFKKYTNAISGCFGGIKISYPSYYSSYYDESGISLFGIMVGIIIIATVVILRKNRYARLCGYWMGVSVVLFPIIGFSYEDFSMHMILFSWAAVSLVAMFYEYLKGMIKNKAFLLILNIFVGSVLIWEAVTNLSTLNELISYASRFNHLLN